MRRSLDRGPSRGFVTIQHPMAAASLTDRSRVRPAAGLLLGLAAVALVVRLGPMLARGELRDVLAYDDGVYFAGTQQLLAGGLPYEDFLFLHPPGILLALAPFALLGDLLGDAWGFALARLAMIAVGVVNTVLIARLLRGYGTAAMIAGAGLYAVWSATVEPERTLLLEPLLTLGVLGALTVMRRNPLLAGVFLGLALSVKLWPAPLIAVLALWLWRAHGFRAAGLLAAGAAAATAIWLLPFAALTGGDMLDQVVTQQGDRPREGVGLTERFDFFDGLVGFPGIDDKVPGALMVLIALALAAGVVLAARRLRDEMLLLWAALAVVAMLELLAAPSFYGHYASYAAPFVCLVAAVVLAPLLRARVLAVAGGLALAVLALSSMRITAVEDVDHASLERFAEDRRCVWARSPSLLVLAGVSADQLDRDCPNWVDPDGHLVSLGPADPLEAPLFEQAPKADRWQQAVRAQLDGSDGAILLGDFDAHGWSEQTAAHFRERFARTSQQGTISLWRRR